MRILLVVLLLFVAGCSSVQQDTLPASPYWEFKVNSINPAEGYKFYLPEKTYHTAEAFIEGEWVKVKSDSYSYFTVSADNLINYNLWIRWINTRNPNDYCGTLVYSTRPAPGTHNIDVIGSPCPQGPH